MLRQSQLGFLHIASGATVAAVTGTGSSQAAEAQLQLWSPNTYLFKIFGACIASPYVEEVVLRDSGFTKKTFVETQPGMATDIAGFVMPVIVSANQRSAPYGRVTRASDYFPTARRPMPAPIFLRDFKRITDAQINPPGDRR